MISKTYEFSLPTITCVSCTRSIEIILEQYKKDHPWLESHYVDLTTKRLKISINEQDTNEAKIDYNVIIAKEVEEIGFRCIPLSLEDLIFEPEPKEIEKGSKIADKIREFFTSHWFQGLIGTTVGLSLLILSLLTGGLPIPIMIIIGTLSSLLTLILGFPSYKDAFMKLWKSRTLTMDMLFTLSTLTVLIVSALAFFVPWLPMMFEAGLLIFGFRHVGLAIEESLKNKLGIDKRFQQRLPRCVNLLIDEDKVELCPLLNIKNDDVIVINPGEIIPLDGVCLTENNLIYETIRTGSPLPRNFKKGELVYSGMYLAEDAKPLKLQVTADVHNSYLARFDKAIEAAQFEKAPIEETATRLLQYFIPGVIAFAILSGITISLFFPPALAIQCAIAVLVSACPCTLGLIVPFAVKIGLRKAAINEVEFKSAKKIQEAAAIDAIIFDLHGTLTKGAPVVSNLKCLAPDTDEHMMLAYAATIEQKSKHPMARAICNYVETRKVQILEPGNKVVVDTSNHSGLSGQIKGEKITIGDKSIMREAGIDVTSVRESIDLNVGETVIYIARNNKLLGYFILTDPLRNEAHQTIAALKKLEKQVYICTGAEEQTALRYAAILGIPADHVAAAHVGLAVQKDDKAKIDFIRSLQAKNLKVAMLGDGDNDTHALAQCDFGIAIKSSSSSEDAQQQSGAIIQGESLLPVVSLFAIAKQTVSNIKQNLALSLSYNSATLLVASGLLVFIGFSLNPGVGVALMVLQTALILGNTYRFKRKSLEHLKPQSSNTDTVEMGSYEKFKNIFHLRDKPSLNDEIVKEVNLHQRKEKALISNTSRVQELSVPANSSLSL
ncbi:cation transporting ATPase PacS [Legionella busanensis]|uniref:Cation transporting ATPase PacS n=1 Tax=Legionella busanensis TaxID=190655 RepID=A0A378JHS6_9GAMM|nr:HAD-IC family P-type ATPase [Legionella busanensis]STX50577.1 cation transporting ATPase PacS [Legionella busanensis]